MEAERVRLFSERGIPRDLQTGVNDARVQAPTIARTLHVAESGPIHDLEVSVDITHSYIGDLAVTLVSPTGRQTVLHTRGGASQDNLVSSFRFADTPALQALRGQSLQRLRSCGWSSGKPSTSASSTAGV